MKVLCINAADTTRHVSSANTAIYPNLGLLTLLSALVQRILRTDVGYLDGTVYGNDAISEFITCGAASLRVLCFSTLTANYGASLELARIAKALNPNIITIFGNDHFSALAERILRQQPLVDFGFYGNDVVEGFTAFVADFLGGKRLSLCTYPGLVYRMEGAVHRNPECPEEYGRLPLVDYSLADTAFVHQERYLQGQRKVYTFIRERGLKSQVIDIGRGCVKFAGEREADIPISACDFCGIIPGQNAITQQSAKRAWEILRNVHEQGFNYFYITADELPLTMWPMLRSMAEEKPEWYRGLSPKPQMFGYARAEGFDTQPEKIRVLINELGFNQFFIGFDGLSEISLKAMNKASPTSKRMHADLVRQNVQALQSVVAQKCLVTAGLVVTHLGITRRIMDENYGFLKQVVDAHPDTFAALDFGPLCPIPGSQSFRYLTNPEIAEARATALGLRVNRTYLESVAEGYRNENCFDMNTMHHDFIMGCCPDIDQGVVDEHIAKITELAHRHNIVVGGGV